MRFCNFDINKNYFFINPKIALPCEDYGLVEINNKEYFANETGEKYLFIDSYDFGEGRESCYVLDRKYSFEELIKLALVESLEEKQYDKNRYVGRIYQADKNHYGAIDFIINGTPYQSGFIGEFIGFLKELVQENNLDEFNKKYLRKFFHSESGCYSDYMKKLDKNAKWLEIKTQVLNLLDL